MHSRYYTSKKAHVYSHYVCVNRPSRYAACPDLPQVRTHNVDKLVWEDCCRVFEELDLIRGTIAHNIQQSLHTMLEDTWGKQLIMQLQGGIAYATTERDKHPKGSYYYTLIDQDIRTKQDRLRRCEEEYTKSHDVRKLADVYQESILAVCRRERISGHASCSDKRP